MFWDRTSKSNSAKENHSEANHRQSDVDYMMGSPRRHYDDSIPIDDPNGGNILGYMDPDD